MLIGLIELFLKSGRPIGSQTLQESGFSSLSSATIRNYFGKLEEQGYLKQPHTSGGRIPTTKALRLYADLNRDEGLVEAKQAAQIESLLKEDGKDIFALIHRASETLSALTHCAVFISAPRFDQDFIQHVRVLRLGPAKLLAVLVTDFGLIRTETLYLESAVKDSMIEQIENYFLWRLGKGEKPLLRDEEEELLVQNLYNEVMVRHVVGYANFPEEDVLRAGLSRLLAYPEFGEVVTLINSLSLLEDETQMRALLRECCKADQLTCWIGDELCPYVPPESENAVIAIPYRIHQGIVGAVALLGPTRLPYRNLFGLLQLFSHHLGQALTESVHKFQMTFRQAASSGLLTHTGDSK